MKRYILILLAVMSVFAVEAREVYSLNNDWRFFFKNENTGDNARYVTVPHTWNLDALTGSRTYEQTTGNYLREIYIPSEWSGKRLFLRFFGVQSVADVFLNGEHIGEHRGGWTAFTFEITDKVRFDGDNLLHVMVSNAYQNDVLPTSTEMNLYGGIYRDVELIVTEPTTVTPMFYGTDGIMINQHSVSRERVDGEAVIYLTSTRESMCNVTLSIIGPDGYAAVHKSLRAKTDGKAVTVPFAIETPELWSPSSPKLYDVRVVAGSDTLSIRTGFRKIEVTPEKRFMLNGRTTPVRGVALYHDRAGVGNAMTNKQYAEDLTLIRDMGANAIRSATAPHAQCLYDMCDEQGVLVWVDFPLTQAPFLSDIPYFSTRRFEDNGRTQVREIIAQNNNHPSVVMWGVFSLLKPRGEKMMGYVKGLNSLAKKLDPSRPTVACSNQDGDINFITDLIVWQQSLGWDKGKISDVKIWCDLLAGEWKHLRQAISYGACSAVGEPSDIITHTKYRGNKTPAIWQRNFHEGYVRELVGADLFWGTWINNMFDFGATRYLSGVLNAGLVELDHKTTKDTYYLYRALWNRTSPTLHIKGKINQYRSRTDQKIKFYSSSAEPVLIINGDTAKISNVGPCQYESEVLQLRGVNDVEVVAGDLRDRMTLTIGNVLKSR
ncbi:MAG: beta-galactosidase [Alistipes sp.]|nr:beta-galactosidase [Alistipes sp.]